MLRFEYDTDALRLESSSSQFRDLNGHALLDL